MTRMFDLGVIFWGEIGCQSLLRVKRLNASSQTFLTRISQQKLSLESKEGEKSGIYSDKNAIPTPNFLSSPN